MIIIHLIYFFIGAVSYSLSQNVGASCTTNGRDKNIAATNHFWLELYRIVSHKLLVNFH